MGARKTSWSNKWEILGLSSFRMAKQFLTPSMWTQNCGQHRKQLSENTGEQPKAGRYWRGCDNWKKWHQVSHFDSFYSEGKTSQCHAGLNLNRKPKILLPWRIKERAQEIIAVVKWEAKHQKRASKGKSKFFNNLFFFFQKLSLRLRFCLSINLVPPNPLNKAISACWNYKEYLYTFT